MAFSFGHKHKYLDDSLTTCSFRLTMAMCFSLAHVFPAKDFLAEFIETDVYSVLGAGLKSH